MEAADWNSRIGHLIDCERRGAFHEAGQLMLDAPVAPDYEEQLRDIVALFGDRPECVLGVRQVLAWYVGANPESALARVIQARHTLRSGDPDIALAQYRSAKKRDRAVSDPELDALLAAAIGATVVPAAGKAAPTPVPAKKTSTPTPVPAKRSNPAPVPPKAEADPPPTAAQIAETPPSTPPREKRRPQPVPAKKEPSPAPLSEPATAPESNSVAESQAKPAEAPEVSATSADSTSAGGTESQLEPDKPLLVVGEGEIVHAHEKIPDSREKLSAIIVAVVVHLVIGITLGRFVVSQQRAQPPQITAIAPNQGEQNSIKRTEIRRIEPSAAPMASVQSQIVTSRAFSNITLPSFDKPVTSFDPIGLGEGFGTSMSLGMGKDGGSVSFFGAKTVSKKVIFVVDFSASMTGTRDELMRKELTRSVMGLPNGVQYQVICFSGPAWFAGQQVGESPSKVDQYFGNVVTDGTKKHIWYEGWDQSERHDGNGSSALYHYSGGESNLPRGNYITATRTTLKTTVEQIEKTPLVFGTDWRWPLMMAMNMKPDTIYFMTDGAFGTGDGVSPKQMVDSLLAFNRKNSNARINTVCMMVLQAKDELEQLANATRGEFTLVEADGTVKRARDLGN
jgi:hypothetical protein